jgi:hypothetical protein
MKKGLPKFMLLADENPLKDVIFRSQYPKFLFELVKTPQPNSICVNVMDLDQHVVILRDIDNFGELPPSYIAEAVRWWKYIVEDYVTITYDEIDALLKHKQEVALTKSFEWINGAYVADDCFRKDRTWLYQRLNGNIVNGKPAELNSEQKYDLGRYFRNKARELDKTANMLESNDFTLDSIERFQIIDALEKQGILAHHTEFFVFWKHMSVEFRVSSNGGGYKLTCDGAHIQSFVSVQGLVDYFQPN